MKTMTMTHQAFEELCEVVLNVTMEMSNMQRPPTDAEGLALLTTRALVGLGALPLERITDRCVEKVGTADMEINQTLRDNITALFGRPEILQHVGIRFEVLH